MEIPDDSPAALSPFDSQRPALVLSDINRSIGDAFEIARYVRQRSAGTPVILMTMYHSADAPQEACRAGTAGYLRKPFSNSELIAAVDSQLDGCRGGDSG